MKVLISGADGFIGSNVLQYLLNNTGWEFTAICSWRHHGNPLNVPISNRVEVITHDLVGPIPEIGSFDYFLHLASESHVDRSQADPVNFIENNISSTLQMLEYAREHCGDKFIMFSTDEVYGAHDHEEWDILRPSNPYAASKGAQELIAMAYKQTFDVPVIITNSNNVVGRNQNPEKFIPKLIGLINDDKTVDIHTVKGKPGRRHYNPVENIGSALKFILDHNYWPEMPKFSKALLGISEPPQIVPRYSLYGGEEYNNLEVAQMVADALGKKLKHRMVEASTIRPGYDSYYPEVEGYLSVLGWKPKFKLEDTLRWMTK